ncbi:phage tail sheath subtilisin-like domain-containing protein [Variovorax sp. J22R24]|uniref:phage tail sheath family protein n=1 Tax=Variovorax gracilis TaxID=3053502 RepID=UPI0025788CB1|nr:phage tail sheath C-terminal domain-containing protein [Variovorax sp. J22R24]MDM0109622.1 phage tail sheath subtilisin-like domain-containing protein [Variovorax sp. J22R24]
MRIFETPGVYSERADANSGGVSALRTDIAGFVGIADRGPLHLAVPVESYRQFQAWFGDTIANGYLAYTARAFFENGGRRLWGVRVASPAASAASVTLLDNQVAPQPLWRIEASSPGTWGDALSIRVTELRRTQRRARLDPAAPQRVIVGMAAGFAQQGLIELQQPGAAPQRAIVRGIDPTAGVLELDRAPTGLAIDQPLRIETLAWSIEVFNAGVLLALIDELSLVPEHPRYAPALLKQPWQIIDRRVPDSDPPGASSQTAIQHFRVGRNRSGAAPGALVVRELRDAADRAHLNLPAIQRDLLVLTGGADGLATLAEADFIGRPLTPFDSDLLQADARRGLAALDPVDEIGVVAVPDIQIQPREPAATLPPPRCNPDACLPNAPAPVPPTSMGIAELPPRFGLDAIARVQAAQLEHCERHHDRFALLDAPFDTCAAPLASTAGLRAWRQRFESMFGALYAPWPRVVDPLRARAGGRPRGTLREIPPCGHVAGLIAATDLRRGVHAAPANAPLQWVQEFTMAIDDERHGLLNTLGVNVLRADAGRGLRVLGARTLSSDTDWRFVNVRRLMCMIEKAIDAAIQWAVFEPNDWRTRAKLALVIGSFLQSLFERGAMVGATAAEAFFVRCDDGNNPSDSRSRGELHIDIGIAPTVPFEFIVLRIGRDANGFAIHESNPVQAAA